MALTAKKVAAAPKESFIVEKNASSANARQDIDEADRDVFLLLPSRKIEVDSWAEQV